MDSLFNGAPDELKTPSGELVMRIIRQLIERRKLEWKFPDGAYGLDIQREIHGIVQNVLNDLETEGVLASFPTVNGVKVYSFKTQ